MEVFVFDWWWRSHQSLAREGLRIFRSCIMPWKDKRKPTIKYYVGRKIELVQKFITTQNFGQKWWWANGIRVEYLPRTHHNASCRCWTTSHGDLKTIKKIANQVLNLFLSMQRNSEQDNGHSSGLDQRKSGILSVKQSTRWMGQNRWEDDGDTRRKRTPSLPIHESIIQRSAHRQRWWKIVNTLLRWPGNDWNCSSHNYFCQSAQFLRSSLRYVWRMWHLPR